MGQAKERKARFGEWYGRPIGPGHPDFVPPKKPEPVPPWVRFSSENSDDPPVEIGAETVSFFREDGRIVVDRLFSIHTKEQLGAWFSGNEGKGILFTGSIARRVELVEVDDRQATFAWLGMPKEEPTMTVEGQTLVPGDSLHWSGDGESKNNGIYVAGKIREQDEPIRQQEEPPTVRDMPRRPARNMAFLSMVLGLAAMTAPMFGPEPEYRPKKR